METNSNKIFEEILWERKRQDEQWGGARNDEKNSRNDWVSYIVYQLGKSTYGGEKFREAMVKVAALALAAIESYDRAKNRQSLLADPDW